MLSDRVSWRDEGPVLAVVAAGGVLGACARYGVGLLRPAGASAFPWGTLLVNVVGCAAMGVLMVLVTEVLTPHPLVRPFLGTGVLGGFTTFSTYAVDVHRLLAGGEPARGIAYLGGTLVSALAAVWAGTAVTRRLAVPR
ncbi:fluoride efflux transporter CrcB [Kitasatospora sp. NPDC101801]|uniref:fluoride efflux transporter CrcB n=1 Tax=Kitasatospora sp. NPDC101801 TaxID=3364103 RepID=UPI0037F10287